MCKRKLKLEVWYAQNIIYQCRHSMLVVNKQAMKQANYQDKGKSKRMGIKEMTHKERGNMKMREWGMDGQKVRAFFIKKKNA